MKTITIQELLLIDEMIDCELCYLNFELDASRSTSADKARNLLKSADLRILRHKNAAAIAAWVRKTQKLAAGAAETIPENQDPEESDESEIDKEDE